MKDGGFLMSAEMAKVWMNDIRWGNAPRPVTEENHAAFNIPLLHARMLAARAKGKYLVIDYKNELSLVDTIEEPRYILNAFSIDYTSEDLQAEEIAPRNRAERRQGVKKTHAVWEKDWGIRK